MAIMLVDLQTARQTDGQTDRWTDRHKKGHSADTHTDKHTSLFSGYRGIRSIRPQNRTAEVSEGKHEQIWEQSNGPVCQDPHT